jgi:hypothetical protein
MGTYKPSQKKVGHQHMKVEELPEIQKYQASIPRKKNALSLFATRKKLLFNK